MLEIKQDTDIRQVASLLRTDLKTAAELIITCLLYEATWKLCPEKAILAENILLKYKPISSFFDVEGYGGGRNLFSEEICGFAYRYHFVQMTDVALVRDRLLHRWLIAERKELKIPGP
jgi:hypothetical protein